MVGILLMIRMVWLLVMVGCVCFVVVWMLIFRLLCFLLSIVVRVGVVFFCVCCWLL